MAERVYASVGFRIELDLAGDYRLARLSFLLTLRVGAEGGLCRRAESHAQH